LTDALKKTQFTQKKKSLGKIFISELPKEVQTILISYFFSNCA